MDRLRNMVHAGRDVKPYACPRCGGIDWATTRERIAAEQETFAARVVRVMKDAFRRREG
jgi:hypothetical protein